MPIPQILSLSPSIHTHISQIKTPQSALLSNHEVLLHLLTEEAEYTGTDASSRARKKPSGLNHVLRDGLAYLQTPDYTTSGLAATHPNRPMTLYKGPNSLFRALAPKYRLNKAEYLQIYNLRPTTQVMLELVVEEVILSFPFLYLPLFSSLLFSTFLILLLLFKRKSLLDSNAPTQRPLNQTYAHILKKTMKTGWHALHRRRTARHAGHYPARL